ncbi:hypothetical protein M3484_20940 [Pseudomonas sp. GX19020]|uniref:hypothetical protein n=1 Tax=Pseudomonas sp. GX19020 TaxID=2942277 RepID=UPI002018B3D4|nr:hypothetical protein [Pseudomonas sp. GX19020]MCL4069028.1 hypothetical protein [Pseudomonas sp. GX19020]
MNNRIPTPRRHGKTFADVVADARAASPFGRFDSASREGLIRRGIAMGLRRAAAASVVDESDRRARHPITRGIE